MSEIESYLAQSPGFRKAVVGYLIEDEKVLLGVREKVSDGLGEKLIAGIGGKVEEGESDEGALIREMKEEIDTKILSFQNMGRVVFLFPHKPRWNMDVAVFTVHDWNGDPQRTDVIHPHWYDIKNLPREHMWPDNHFWLPKVLAGDPVHATFLYDKNGRVIEHVFDK